MSVILKHLKIALLKDSIYRSKVYEIGMVDTKEMRKHRKKLERKLEKLKTRTEKQSTDYPEDGESYE